MAWQERKKDPAKLCLCTRWSTTTVITLGNTSNMNVHNRVHILVKKNANLNKLVLKSIVKTPSHYFIYSSSNRHEPPNEQIAVF